MTKTFFAASLLIIFSLNLTGCASKGGSTSSNTESSAQQSNEAKESLPQIVGDIPPGSPFSKIDIGMSAKHVIDLIGPPTDQKNYVTGKAFVPFYFGSDRARVEYLYKGQGRITLTGGSGFGGGSYKVHRIIYDSSETGYSE